MIGRPVRRLEDDRLITGQGRYVDDIVRTGMLHAAFVRSPMAHAEVGDVDVSAARDMAGVHAVWTAADLGVEAPMPNLFPAPFLAESKQGSPLAHSSVHYAGEPVAMVVADTRRQAVDAAGMVFADFETRTAVVNHQTALDPEAPLAHSSTTSNLMTTLRASYGDVDGAFEGAAHVIPVTIHQHRGACAAIETRGVLADFDATLGQLLVWSSTQSPFLLRRSLCGYFDLALDTVRVIAPDVGGGFGPKAALYCEEYAVAAAAQMLGRPVKWVEGRREHFVSVCQQRDQTSHLEVAVESDGRVRGLRGRTIHDNGAYVPYGVVLPVTGLMLSPGPYVIDALDISIDVVYTNKTPTNPIRGAGRPYAIFAIERVIDAIARELGLDRAEVRRRNFVPPDAFPYEVPIRARDGSLVTYDSGDYGQALDSALAAAEGFEQRRTESRAAGKLRGLGIASYVEDTGLGPFEGARVEVLPSGEVVVETGAASQGQGHATVFAQLVSEQLGVALDQVRVLSADTGRYGYGVSTAASRTAVTAGSSVHLAAAEVASMAKRLAAERLEAAEEDMVLENGMVFVVGQPDAAVALSDLATAMQGVPAVPLPGGSTIPGLAADRAFQMPRPSFAYGTHVVEVEVDPATGHVTVVNYIVAHDCGVMLNPMIVEGQIDGGVAHGLGNALSERVVFSEDGQPLATTFMDYRIMSAGEMPPLTKIHTEIPSPFNPLGVKGAGEGGTIPAAAAVVSAVEDALSEYGIVVDRHPLQPETVYSMIRRATKEHNNG